MPALTMATHSQSARLFVLAAITALASVLGVGIAHAAAIQIGSAYPYLLHGGIASLAVFAFATFVWDRENRNAEKKYQAKFRGLLEAAPEAILVTHRDGTIDLVNARAEKLFGYDRKDLLGQPISAVIGSQQPTPHSACRPDSVTGASSGHPIGAPRFPGRCRSGRMLTVEVSFSPYHAGKDIFTIHLIRDITDLQIHDQQRSARHAVGVTLARAPDLAQAAPTLLRSVAIKLGWSRAVLWVLDPTATMLRRVGDWGAASKATPAEALTLRMGEGLAGQVWSAADVMTGEEAEAALGSLPSPAGMTILGIPIRFGGNVLGVLELHGPATTECDENHLETLQNICSQLAYFLERKRAEDALHQSEQKLRQAQKMEAVGRLAGGVAHDFNNLLTVILGYGNMLLGQFDEEDPRRECVVEMTRAGERAASLTRQLLAFSRKQMLAPRVLDLNTVVADMHRLLERLIGEDVQLSTALAPDLCRVRADPGQIEQVIMNLAVNARDAMPGGGKLLLETKNVDLGTADASLFPEVRPGPYVLVAMTDTGCGMTEDVRSHLFEPFYTTKGPGVGTGLGLAMVYGIIKQSEGHITIDSEPGRGTIVRIYLPATTEEKAAVKPRSAAPPKRGSERLLLVEDEEPVRRITRTALEASGYQVSEAADGEQALDLCHRMGGKIDLLITDVIMPGINGRELADTLKQQYPGLRVLFISGYTDTAAMPDRRLGEDNAFLQKPFTPSSLAKKVRQLLDSTPVAGCPELPVVRQAVLAALAAPSC
jgi:PAS domain S-box-containing protein